MVIKYILKSQNLNLNTFIIKRKNGTKYAFTLIYTVDI